MYEATYGTGQSGGRHASTQSTLASTDSTGIVKPYKRTSTDPPAPPKYVVRKSSPLSKALCQMRYLIAKFNLWASRRSDSISRLDKALQSKMFRTMVSFHQPAPWKLMLKKDDAKGSLVVVKSGLWTSSDLFRYLGDRMTTEPFRVRDHRALHHYCESGLQGVTLLNNALTVDITRNLYLHEAFAKPQLTLHAASPSSATSLPWGGVGEEENEPPRSVYTGTIGMGFSSYWDLHILSDESKQSFFLDVRSTDIHSHEVQNEFQVSEGEQMSAEDACAASLQRVQLREDVRRRLLDEVYTRREKLTSTLIPKLNEHKTRHEKYVKEATSAIRRLEGVLDAWLDDSATCICDDARLSLDLYDIAPKKNKKKGKKGKRKTKVDATESDSEVSDTNEAVPETESSDSSELLRISASRYKKNLSALQEVNQSIQEWKNRKLDINNKAVRLKKKEFNQGQGRRPSK